MKQDKVKHIKELKDKANFYSENNLEFSALIYWKELCKLTENEYYKFRLADTMRLCGFTSDSEKIHNTINIEKIPKKFVGQYYSFLGHLYLDTYRIQDALDAFYKALNFDKSKTYSYVFIASILKTQEKDIEAISLLKKALKKEGNIDEVNYNLSTSYIRLGKYKEALKCINLCLDLDTDFPNANLIKADIEEIIRIKGSH